MIKQWQHLVSPMKEGRVLPQPNIIMKVPTINKFTHYSSELKTFVKVSDCRRYVASCTVYSLNNCTDELRNNIIEQENE